jgi:hypothetical protein
MTMSEFEAVMAELREVRAEQSRQGQILAAHCAAEESAVKTASAIEVRRSRWVPIVATGSAVVSTVVAVAALLLH